MQRLFLVDRWWNEIVCKIKKEQAGETNAPPKTWHQFGFHIVLPEYERSHAWFLMSLFTGWRSNVVLVALSKSSKCGEMKKILAKKLFWLVKVKEPRPLAPTGIKELKRSEPRLLWNNIIREEVERQGEIRQLYCNPSAYRGDKKKRQRTFFFSLFSKRIRSKVQQFFCMSCIWPWLYTEGLSVYFVMLMTNLCK